MQTYAARRDHLRARLDGLGLQAAVVTSPVNVRYLTGLASSNAAVLVTADGSDLLATDARYAGTATGTGVEVALTRAVARDLAERAVSRGLREFGWESHVLTLDAAHALERVEGARWSSLQQAVEELRTQKDEAEVALLSAACGITDTALDELRDRVRVGMTERELARTLEARFGELGADGPAFASIVAGGPHSAVPHHSPTDRALEAGDLLKVDCGAAYAGYCADTTRTWVVGAEPADWQRDLHALVLGAQRAGAAAVVDGADVREVDRAARAVIEEAGHGEHFEHGLGHGVGLEVHEAPMLGPRGEGRLSSRVPVTVEPGVYLPGRGGVRIEDVFLVRAGSGPQQLTGTGSDLVRVG